MNFWIRHKEKRTSGLHLLGIFFTILSFITATDCLRCFQCASTATDGGRCLQDHSGLVNASKGTGSLEYLKNCTDTHSDPVFDRCFIEYHLGPKDEFVFYHRGCHDGLTFNKKVGSTRFDNLKANNETTCAKPPDLLKEVVCFTFCNSDLCNGPQPPPEEVNACLNQSEADACGVNCLHSHMVWVLLLSCFAILKMYNL